MEQFSPDDKLRLRKFFNNANEGKIVLQEKTKNSDILLVDSMNTFIRSFSAIPTLNGNGLHIGGISGFLKSIGFAIKVLKPTRVICVFDGEGGSQKRRKIYSEYKSGRRSRVRFNRTYDEMTSISEENKNMELEFARIIDYLKKLPVSIVAVPQIEADDTIAYLANEYFKDSNRISIMSTDKDFLQLANEKIKIWSPTKKNLYSCSEILKEYGISCKNFIYYRALSGDESDNIPGIRGSGLKTVIKAFPFLTLEEESSIQEIINYSENNIKKYKIYENVVEGKDILKRNFTLMQLHSSIIQPFTQLKINDIIERPVPTLNNFEFSKMIYEDCMFNVFENYNSWLNETWASINSLI